MFKHFIFTVYFMTFFVNGFAAKKKHPFSYDLHLTRIQGTSPKIMVVFHGIGGDYQLGPFLKSYTNLKETIVSFNLPDYDLNDTRKDLKTVSFGTINEILPGIYILKKLIVDEGNKNVNLYGFSAGGGIIIDTIYVLTNSKYDTQLKEIGVSQSDKNKILEVLEKGTIILDAPLKSFEEIAAYKGNELGELLLLKDRYQKNQLEPIHILTHLKDLSFHIILNFQDHDEILSNRDDSLFIERLKKANSKGTTDVIFGKEGGHLLPHDHVWKFYHLHQ